MKSPNKASLASNDSSCTFSLKLKQIFYLILPELRLRYSKFKTGFVWKMFFLSGNIQQYAELYFCANFVI